MRGAAPCRKVSRASSPRTSTCCSPEPGAHGPQPAHVEQGFRLRRQGSEPLAQFRPQLINVAGR